MQRRTLAGGNQVRNGDAQLWGEAPRMNTDASKANRFRMDCPALGQNPAEPGSIIRHP